MMLRRRWIGMLLLTGLLAGCGRAAARTPEATHAAWIDGLQQQDQAALVALMARPQADLFVRDSLQSLWSRVRSTQDGPLEAVTLLGVEQDARGRFGVSAWRFATVTACYRTRLAEQDGRWTVTDWGLMPRCPTVAP